MEKRVACLDVRPEVVGVGRHHARQKRHGVDILGPQPGAEHGQKLRRLLVHGRASGEVAERFRVVPRLRGRGRGRAMGPGRPAEPPRGPTPAGPDRRRRRPSRPARPPAPCSPTTRGRARLPPPGRRRAPRSPPHGTLRRSVARTAVSSGDPLPSWAAVAGMTRTPRTSVGGLTRARSRRMASSRVTSSRLSNAVERRSRSSGGTNSRAGPWPVAARRPRP